MKIFQKIKYFFLPKHRWLVMHRRISKSFLDGLEEGLKK